MPDGQELVRQEEPRVPQLSANRKLTTLSVDEMIRVATGFARSQVFKKGRDPLAMEELFVTIMAGQELGLGPAQSVMSIQMIEGKPNLSANLQAALLKASGKYDYRVDWGYDDSLGLIETACKAHGQPYPNPNWCSVKVIHTADGSVIGTTVFTMQDADRAGLLKDSFKGNPSNYLVYPRNMLFARAISNAVAFYAADSTMVRTYHEGEAPERGEEPQAAPPPDPDPSQTRLARPPVEPEEEVVSAGDVSVVEGENADTRQHEAAVAKGEVKPGESVHEAMERMVAEEEDKVRDETLANLSAAGYTPPPATADAFTGDPGPPEPSVDQSEHEPTLTPGQIRLLHVKCGLAGFTDERRRQVLKEVTGEGHADRIPRRLMDAVLERLEAEIEAQA